MVKIAFDPENDDEKPMQLLLNSLCKEKSRDENELSTYLAPSDLATLTSWVTSEKRMTC